MALSTEERTTLTTWFRIFSRDVMRGGTWKSKANLVKHIMTYIRQCNETRAKPFRWTYTSKPLAAR